MHSWNPPVRIERTRNKHSRAVCLDDTIVIRLARNLTHVQEHKHVETLLRRMKPFLERETRKIPIHPFSNILESVEPQTRIKKVHRFLWKLLSASMLPQIRTLIEEINEETLRVSIRGIRLRYASSLWGSCSHGGDILLNTALLFLPQKLLRYVIIHELAHTVHRNHSEKYWKTVERFMPEYREARAALRQYRLPTL